MNNVKVVAKKRLVGAVIAFCCAFAMGATFQQITREPDRIYVVDVAPYSQNTIDVETPKGQVEKELPKGMSYDQFKMLQYARKVAQEAGIKRPDVFQAIIWQESKAGGHGDFKVAGVKTHGPAKRYYGLAQLKVVAAREVLNKYPEMYDLISNKRSATDDEIIANLILNDDFNLRIAAMYFKMKGKQTDSLEFQIAAYNQGYEGAKAVMQKMDLSEFEYTKYVMNHTGGIIRRVNKIADSERFNIVAYSSG